MATSAEKLSTIITELSKLFKFDEDDAFEHLAKKELLPKKLMPQIDKEQSPWASKRAQEFGEEHGVQAIKGTGSGKDGRWTLADVQKQLQKPVKDKVLISPNALMLAKDNKINVVGIKGSGKDGRILVKDVEALIQNDDLDEGLNITARAYQEAYSLKISDEELESIKGTGQDGRILLKDIQDYHLSSSEKEEKKKAKKQDSESEPEDSDDE
jgi:pyruvate/2-oxoglutarate dehydrogenase complex dihydrolipoamide acyltransferase (E2) component